MIKSHYAPSGKRSEIQWPHLPFVTHNPLPVRWKTPTVKCGLTHARQGLPEMSPGLWTSLLTPKS